MIRTRTAVAIALAAAFGAGTALAQTTGSGTSSAPSTTGPGATTGAGTTNPGRPATPTAPSIGATTANRDNSPAARNPVLTDREDVRASKVIGSTVYNDKDEKIGSIDDILMDKDHKASAAVLSVGGFLGIGAKLVEVPYDHLQFGDTRDNSDNKVKLPGATKDSLNGMPEYRYRG